MRVGDLVEVRSREEILAQLDHRGETDGLPFMPEMLRFCGSRFRVSAVAHKACDTIKGTGTRRLKDAVHLGDLRCDGSSHEGCQASCLLFWKTDWLRVVKQDLRPSSVSPSSGNEVDAAILEEHTRSVLENGRTRFRCQATQLFDATKPWSWWDIRQYWVDVASGNVSLGRAMTALLLGGLHNLRRLPFGHRLSLALYEHVHQLLRNAPSPHLSGRIPKGVPTPDDRLDLEVGERVIIRSKGEIEKTVSPVNRNRGLKIDEEMSAYCGGSYVVKARIEHIINEASGEMMDLKHPCIVLDGVYCRGDYSSRRLLCPRRITAYWREVWLEREMPK